MDNSEKLTTDSTLDERKNLNTPTSTFLNVNFENVKSAIEGQVCQENQQSSMGSMCATMDQVDSQDPAIQLQDVESLQMGKDEKQPLSNKTTEDIDMGEDAVAFQATLSQNQISIKEDESERQEQRMQRQEKEAYEEKRNFIMGNFLDTAIDNRWNTMSIHIKNWINEHLDWDNNHTKIYNLNVNIMWNEWEILKQVPSELQRDFSIELHNRSQVKYRNYANEIVETIKKFEAQIAENFSRNGYMEENETEDIMSHQYDRITNAVQDSSIRTIFQHVRKRFFDILKDHNNNLSRNEAILQEDVKSKIVKHYNENMKKFLMNEPHNMDALKYMHTQLVMKFTKLYVDVLTFSSGKPSNDVFQKSDELKIAMETDFVSYETLNLKKINELHAKTKEIISSCEQMYTKMINEIASQDSNGICDSVLVSQHMRIKNKVGEILEFEIRSKIGTHEPVNGYKMELQYLMNTYFQKILKVNKENYEKFQHENEEKVLHSNEPTSSASVSNVNSVFPAENDKPHKVPSMTLVIDFKNCTQLSMAVKQNNKSTIVLNEFNESETPATVGYSYVDEKFVYGTQVTWLLKRWNLAHNLDTDYTNSSSVTCHGVYRTVSFEFLLAFILRKLKFAAEAQIGNILSSALIIIPFWFSSTHRVKMQDGVKLAGFPEVNLVHESSCAAFSCIPNTTDGKLLVIIANRYGVRAFQYNCNKNAGKVQLINYWKILEIKYKNGVLDIGKDKVTKLLKDYQKVKKSIKKELGTVFEEIKVGSCPLPVYISESEEWKGMLNKIAKELPHRHIIDYPSADLDGALDLSENPAIICALIEDILSYDIFVKDFGVKSKVVKTFACSKTPLSSEKDFKTTNGWIEFLQKHELDEEMRRIQLLEVKTAWSNQVAKVTMGISSEGIFGCERCKAVCDVDGESGKIKGRVDVDRYFPNLSEKEFEGLAIWLDNLLPGISREKFEIIQAKKHLLQLCGEMREKIESKGVYFESELSKLEVLEQICEGKEFAEHPNSSLDDLKEQTEILDSLYKYCVNKLCKA